jgi:hypothetical protein
MYVYVLWNNSNFTDILTKISREIRGTSCAIIPSTQHTALKWLSGIGHGGKKIFFLYGAVNLFVFSYKFLKFSCNLIDTWLHMNPIAGQFLE